jgi:hypothetical protein
VHHARKTSRQQGSVQILLPFSDQNNCITTHPGLWLPSASCRINTTSMGTHYRIKHFWCEHLSVESLAYPRRDARGVSAVPTCYATSRRNSITHIPLMDSHSLRLEVRMHSARFNHYTRECCTALAKGPAGAWSNCHPITVESRTRTYTTTQHTCINEEGSADPSLRPVWPPR